MTERENRRVLCRGKLSKSREVFFMLLYTVHIVTFSMYIDKTQKQKIIFVTIIKVLQVSVPQCYPILLDCLRIAMNDLDTCHEFCSVICIVLSAFVG